MSADFLQDLAYRHLTRTMNTLAGGLTLLGAPHPRNCAAFFLVQLGFPLEYLFFIFLFLRQRQIYLKYSKETLSRSSIGSAYRYLRSFARPIQSRSYQ